ncbi:MAG: tetratricopeptide repeat protein [bacterium]|nr:tetratricopeptide repeat protein [bacterium]
MPNSRSRSKVHPDRRLRPIAREEDELRGWQDEGRLGFLSVTYRQAALDLALGDWAKAESRLLKVRDRLRTDLGEEHPELGCVLADLGRLYMAAGAFQEADDVYRAALESFLRKTPDDHLLLGRLYHTLGHVAWIRGLPGRAEASFQAAWKRWAATLRKCHPEAARVANDLGALYHENGRLPAARALYEHARRILEEGPRERFPQLGGCLNNLALLSLQVGELERAAALLQQYLDYRSQSRGRNDPKAARSLSRLAEVERRLRHDGAARRLHEEAVALCRDTLGPQHPESAAALARLAGHCLALGEAETATKWLRQALRIQRRTLGPHHPRVAATLCELAAARADAGALDETWKFLGEATYVDQRWPRRIAPQSLRRFLRWTGLRERLERILGLVREHFVTDRKAVTWAFELLLRQRGLSRTLDRLVDRPLPVEGKERALHLLQLRSDHRWLAGPGCEDLARHRQLLASWLWRCRCLRQELGRSGRGEVPTAAGSEGRQCRRALQEGEALVDLVRVRMGAFAELMDSPLTIYLAFVTTCGGQVQMIELGEAGILDAAVDRFDSGSDGASLRSGIFDPLHHLLRDTERLLLVLEGPLGRLPLERLPLGDGRALEDRYELVYLDGGDDLP